MARGRSRTLTSQRCIPTFRCLPTFTFTSHWWFRYVYIIATSFYCIVALLTILLFVILYFVFLLLLPRVSFNFVAVKLHIFFFPFNQCYAYTLTLELKLFLYALLCGPIRAILLFGLDETHAQLFTKTYIRLIYCNLLFFLLLLS